jgi:hypothetical protein
MKRIHKSGAGDKRQDSQGEVQRGEVENWNVLERVSEDLADKEVCL